MRKRWIQIDGELISADEYQAPEPTSALVMNDIAPYKSMITGEMVNSRSRHRELLRQHGCVEVGNDSSLYKKPQPLKSPPGLKQELIRAFDKHIGS